MAPTEGRVAKPKLRWNCRRGTPWKKEKNAQKCDAEGPYLLQSAIFFWCLYKAAEIFLMSDDLWHELSELRELDEEWMGFGAFIIATQYTSIVQRDYKQM